jgi:NADH-quinone oxidoreductase subunit L
VPLIALAIPSVLIGYFLVQPMLFGGWFGSSIQVEPAHDVLRELGHEFHGPLAMALHAVQTLPFWLLVAGFVVTSYIYLYNVRLADTLKRVLRPVYVALEHKFWVNDLLLGLFGTGGIGLGRVLSRGADAGLIDGIMVNGSAKLVENVAGGVRRIQSGYLYHYAFAMIIGLILLLGGFWWFGGMA